MLTKTFVLIFDTVSDTCPPLLNNLTILNSEYFKTKKVELDLESPIQRSNLPGRNNFHKFCLTRISVSCSYVVLVNNPDIPSLWVLNTNVKSMFLPWSSHFSDISDQLIESNVCKEGVGDKLVKLLSSLSIHFIFI